MISSRTVRFVVLCLVLVGTAGCDQAAKHVARTRLAQRGSITLCERCLEFTLAENPGAFLSLGASLPQVTRRALTGCVGVGLAFVLVYLLRAPRMQWVLFLGLALVLAGGISNLIDRFLRDGLVTDFMILRLGPLHTGVFNVADVAIVVGALLPVAALGVGRFRNSAEPTDVR